MKSVPNDNCIAGSGVPLFRDFNTYCRSLPLRLSPGSCEHIPLHTSGYFVRPEELKHMVAAIEKPTTGLSLKYLCAPRRSGKTASVLAAFLQSEKATHYLYLAFAKNFRRYFGLHLASEISDDVSVAKRQGAFFIAECVKNLLTAPDDLTSSYVIAVPNSSEALLSCEAQTYKLGDYLHQQLGNDANIWFHIDECDAVITRGELSVQENAFFEGAIQTLAGCLKGCQVITSNLEPPHAIPPESSSTIRRIPIPLPVVDIDQVMQVIPALYINSADMNEAEDRVLASMKFRLGFKLQESGGMMCFLHKQNESEHVQTFLQAFKEHANIWNDVQVSRQKRRKALEECNKLCIFNEPIIVQSHEANAARLLLGIEDDENADLQYDKFIDGVTVTPDSKLSATLMRFMMTIDQKVEPYNQGRNRFSDCLTYAPDRLLVHTPLEAAYMWTIACHSALQGHLRFMPELEFRFKCNDLFTAFRLPRELDSAEIDLKQLEDQRIKEQKSVIYYTDQKLERGERKDSPALLMFLSDDNELVLIDVTSGGLDKANKKIDRFVRWISENSSKFNNYKLRGILLAPNLNEPSRNNAPTTGTAMICGGDALALLGGLNQFRPWILH
jgi:hypothetical protein